MNKDWVAIFHTTQHYKAVIASQILDENDIESVIFNKGDSSYNAFGYVELCVRRDNVIKAKLLIKNIEN
jgi:hypothetical protein